MLYLQRTFLLAALSLFAAAPLPAQQVAEGYIDTAFSNQCFGATSPRALVTQFDGKVIAGGNFRTQIEACVNAIDRMGPNGAPDLGFSSPFPVAGDTVNAIRLQGNKLLVAGFLRDSQNSFPFARLNANGSIDPTFTRAIQNANLIFNALLVQADGKIIAAGDFNVGTPSPQGYMVRYLANGAVDNTFLGGGAAVTSGLTSFPGIAALAPGAGGSVYVGGSFTMFQNAARPGLARINSAGVIDPNYSPQIADGVVRALAVQPDGKLLVAGNFSVNGFVNRALVRLNTNGTVDTTFTPLNGMGTIGLSLALQDDGKILLGHSYGVMRLEANGSPDTSFGPRNAFAQLGTEAEEVTSIAITANGNIIVGARYVKVNDTIRYGVARLHGFVPPAPPPPVFTQQPQTQLVDSGATVTFSVIATGAPPITFQWRKDGTRLRGETNASLVLSNVNSTHIGNYSVVAANIGGMVTSALARLTVRFQTSQLTIVTNGVGAVLPALAGQFLEVGRPYMITARPAVGNLFSNWTGGVTSSSPTITFVMQSNLTLEVNFVPNPFLPVRGVFNGLFFDAAMPSHANAGALSFTLDDEGGYKGSVRMGTKTRKFKGAFSLALTSQVSVAAVPGVPQLALALQLDPATQTISGTVTNALGETELFAYRNPFTSVNPSPFAASYNLLLPGSDADGTVFGDGLASGKLSTSGRGSLKGTLADGTKFSAIAAASQPGHVPVYVPLYRGAGSLFGWLTFSDEEASDIAGTLHWFKPAGGSGATYPGGFTNTVPATGSKYIAPPGGTPVLALENGVLILSGGGLAETITTPISLGGDNRITGEHSLSIVFSPAKGSFKGTFIDPASGAKRTVQGVALPKGDRAGGFFLGDGMSGRVFVGEAEE